jgi:hypothetical protein
MLSILIIFISSTVCLVHGHLYIKSPQPLLGSLTKDPLDPSGSNFPCHGVDLSQLTTSRRTSMAVGSAQPLEFELANGANNAVHGGGSCQISVTYETSPALLKDPSSWKVIKSFIGGCPTDALLNLEVAEVCNGSNSPNCVKQFSFDVPPQVKNGDATLAWTWFNNVGNREMYMSCAAVTFAGGQDKLDELPSMFVANIQTVQCKTTEHTNTDFPDPGLFVERETPPNYPFKPPVGVGCSSASVKPAGPPAQPVGKIVDSPSVAKSVTTPRSSSIVWNVTSVSFSTSTGLAEKGNLTSCEDGTHSCTRSGFFCINSRTFGLCDFGCAIPMSMSRGTKCMNDTIIKV